TTVLRNEAYLGPNELPGQGLPGHPSAAHRRGSVPGAAGPAGRAWGELLEATNASDYLLGGLLTCAHCGSKFIGTPARGNRYHYHTCHRRNRYGRKGCPSERLPAEELDQAVLKAMLEASSNSDLVAEALEEARRRVPAATAQLKEQLAAVEADIRKTEDALER